MAKKNLDAVQPIELTVEHSIPMASSLQMAKHFGKQHNNVLRDIEDLKKKAPEDWFAVHFEPIKNITELGHAQREDPAWMMTRDGFTLLGMGFNGEKAVQWKIKYMEAFNAMEETIRQGQNHQARLELPWQMKEERLEGMKTVINALTKFWAVTDDIAEATATKILCAALKILSLDDFKQEHFSVAWSFIMRALFIPDCPGGNDEIFNADKEKASRYSETNCALLDAVFQLKDAQKRGVNRIFFDAFIPSPDHLLKAGTQKQMIIIWGLFQYWCGYTMATIDAEEAE